MASLIQAPVQLFNLTRAIAQRVIFAYLVYSMSIFWSTIILTKTIFRFIRNPTGFLKLKPRPNKPAVLKREFQHGFVQTSDQGIRIHYVEAGDQHRPLLLFLHGFPEFWYSWRHQLREFKNDYHVVAIDMRGYGDSSKPESLDEYNIENLIEDVRQVVAQLGNDKCNLVAHNWGGAVAWRFALQHSDMVEKLIILNCPHPKAFFDRLHSFHLDQWRKAWFMSFFQCPFLPELAFQANDMEMLNNFLTKPPSGTTNPKTFTEDDIEAWKYTFQQSGAFTPPLNYYRESFALGPAAQNVGGRSDPARGIVKPPVLIIWGTKDFALVTELAFTSLQFCHNGMLRLINGASHLVQQERPEECNQYIRDFLKI